MSVFMKLRYCLMSGYIICRFLGKEEGWIKRKPTIGSQLIKYTRESENFFITYTRVLFCFMGVNKIKDRWKDVWKYIFDEIYLSDVLLFDTMLASLEKSDLKIKRCICFPEVYRDFLEKKILETEEPIDKLVNVCCQEKYGDIKRKTIRHSIEVFSKWSVLPECKSWLIQKCEEYVNKEENEKNKIVLFHLLGEGKCLTPTFFKRYCTYVYQCVDKRVKYYYGVHELSWLVFNNPHLLYEEYHVERKNFLEALAQELWEQEKGCCVKKEEGNKRIAILVDGLHGKVYASARLEIYIANEFARRGYEVSVFVADSNRLEGDFDGFVNPSGTRRTSSEMYKEEHQLMTEKGVRVVYNEANTYEKIFNHYLHKIYEFGPDFIIDILGERTIFDYILIHDYPIITVPLGGFSSCSVFDYIVVRDMQAVRATNKQYYSVDENKAVEGNLYLPYDLTTTKRYTRKKLHIGKKDYVMVTVGNRLKTEINLEFALAMAELLKKYDDMKWMVIGAWRNEFDFLQGFLSAGRIIYTGFEDELPALYKLCDIFINPIRTGGGGSVAMFIQQGGPAIISNSPSDILPFVGEENCINGGIKNMFEAVESIYLDRSLGEKLAERQKEKLMSPEFSVEKYVDCIVSLRKKCTDKLG